MRLHSVCKTLKMSRFLVLQWLPPENQANPEAQAIIKLTRSKEDDLPTLLKDLPIEKFDQILNILQEQKG